MVISYCITICLSVAHNPFVSFPFQMFIKGFILLDWHHTYHLASFPEVTKNCILVNYVVVNVSRAKESAHDTAPLECHAAYFVEAAIDLPHRSRSGNITHTKYVKFQSV